MLAAPVLLAHPAAVEARYADSLWFGRHVNALGRTEYPLAGIGPFVKWKTVLQQYAKERDGAPWKELLARLRTPDRLAQVVVVNAYFNGMRYQSDRQGYGRADRWTTPGRFLARRRGDCEEFAIAKYFALRELGFSKDRLRLLAVFDRTRGRFHMVTVVSLDGRALVLDNTRRLIVELEQIKNYKVLYSLNEEQAWLYVSL